jgi:predicted Zn-dependent peptidase
MYCRAITNLMQRYHFIDNAAAVNSHFTDSGLFGMTIEGPASHSQQLLQAMMYELHSLREPIPDEELVRAKNILKMNILASLERQQDRLEEIAKNYMTFGGQLTFHKYCETIDAVTSQDINRAATKMIEGMPTMIVTGSAINTVASLTDVQKQLNFN